MLAALDTGSDYTGFAFGSEARGTPDGSGVWRLPNDDLDDAAAQLIRNVIAFCEEKAITVLYIEDVLHRFKYRDKKTGRVVDRSVRAELVLKGLYVAARGSARIAGVKVIEAVGPTTWRKHFTGLGRYTKRGDAKAATLAMVRRLGWTIHSTGIEARRNEADALGLWSYGMSMSYPKWAHCATPLFTKVRAA